MSPAPTVAVTAPTDTATGTPRVRTTAGGHRLDGVDSLRAIAALWVVLFHIRAASGAHLGPLDLVVRSGSTGVSLFLVLSGFCLYLPVARDGRFVARRFFIRRARRLLPAYYASILLFAAATIVFAGRFGFTQYSPSALLAQLATHLTMTHSLFPSTFYAINGAWWSLGLEWQLYLGLPLLVIAIRRFGLARTVGAVIAINVVYRLALQAVIGAHVLSAGSSLATDVLPNLLPGRWAEFALGMLAADMYATGRLTGRWSLAGWAAIPLAVLALLAVGNPLSHLIFGAVFFAVLCAAVTRGGLLGRVLAWRPLAAVGVMSYSLYLIHQPIVGALTTVFRQLGLSPRAVFAVVLALVPAILGVAWVLFVTVERRTLRTSGAIEDGSPEWVLLRPLEWARRWRDTASVRVRSVDMTEPNDPAIALTVATPEAQVVES